MEKPFLFPAIRRWLRRRRLARQARRLLAEAFRSPDLLRGTSLEPRHAGRWVLLDFETEGDRIVRIRFGILRHPRPYAFSPQSHKVIEHYLYEVADSRIRRVRGYNITRPRGKDDD